ncbi:MAG: universal stress protein [Thaumarchaeota archaeon]|nr:universal stress protein [Nitrososphaerota archaeon]
MSRYTIRIERRMPECREGRCGHLHEIAVDLKQKQIVCSNLSCREMESSLVRHIFVPYDGSAYSNRAFEFALDLARKYTAAITVGTVMSGSTITDPITDTEEYGKKIVDKERLASIERQFDKIHQLGERFLIPVKTEIFISSVISDSIIDFANSNNVDFIIMGTRGKGENWMMMGSVSTAVSQKARAAVLLIK